MLRQLIAVLADGAIAATARDPLVYRAVGDTTRFGWFYRRRFVGLNRRPSEDTHSMSLPQTLHYPLPAVRGGYLFRQGRDWFIQPALSDADIRFGESFVRVDTVETPLTPALGGQNCDHAVWVKPAPRVIHRHKNGQLELEDPRTPSAVAPRSAPQPPGWVAGRLVRTAGVGNNKHMHIVIYEPDVAARPLDISNALRQLYVSDSEVQRDPNRPGRWPWPPNGAREPPEWRGHPAPFDGWPCFYMVDTTNGDVVFFGGTLFFRLPYKTAPSRFVPWQGVDDLPSQLFGRVDPEPRKGRVRFEDLACTTPNALVAEDWSPIAMLTPKPACIQHYLVQAAGSRSRPGGAVDPATDSKDDLLHYDDAPYNPAQPGDVDTTIARGFKYYWHRKEQGASARDHSCLASTPDLNTRIRTVIRPVREGVVFQGRIHFDNLDEVELGALLVALDLRPNLRHKLGMGRKYGYGSVKIQRSAVRLVDPEARHERFFAEAGTTTDARASALEPGWRPVEDVERTCDSALVAFARRMDGHRGENQIAQGNVDVETALRSFWHSPRMQELSALLEWDNPPKHETTREVSVSQRATACGTAGENGAKARQWKDRKILPPPTAVMGWPDPWPAVIHGASVSPQGGTAPLGSLTVAHADGVAPNPAWELKTLTLRGATASFNAGGGGVLTIMAAGKAEVTKVEARRDAAKKLIESLPESLRKRLMEKKKAIRVDAVVRGEGNNWHIESLAAPESP